MAIAFFDGIFEVFNLYKEVLFSWALIYASWYYWDDPTIWTIAVTTILSYHYSFSSPDHMMYAIIAVNYTTVYNDITSCAWLILSGSRCNYPSWGFTIILHRTINIRLETILRNNFNVMVYIFGIGTIDENVVWFPLMLDLMHWSSDTRSIVTTIMHCVTMAGLSLCLLSRSKWYFAN